MSLYLAIASAMVTTACVAQPRPVDEDSRGYGEPAQESFEDAKGEAVVPLPRTSLAVALRSPFDTRAHSDLSNCPADPTAMACTTNTDCTDFNRLNSCYIPPGEVEGRCGHHRPWHGDWAVDLWAADEPTRGQKAYLRLSPSAMAGGTPPDTIRVQPGTPQFACASEDPAQGGHRQEFTVYGTYAGVEHELGTVLVAHLANMIYDGSPQPNLDPRELEIGDVWGPPLGDDGTIVPPCDHTTQETCTMEEGCLWSDSGTCFARCWVGEHLHVELTNAEPDTESCWQNMCGLDGKSDPPVYGTDSVIGMLGGSDDGDMCPVFVSEEQMACGTWDGDDDDCNAHGSDDPDWEDDTQDCAYYTSVDTCRPRGTSNCQAGIWWECDGTESAPCSDFDGDELHCNAHGFLDPNTADTQDCAYYLHSDRCVARGTSDCSADCDAAQCTGGGCWQCNPPRCDASDPEL